MTKEIFVETYGGIFEHSPWVAEAAWQHGLSEPHDTPDALAELMGLMLQQATPESDVDPEDHEAHH